MFGGNGFYVTNHAELEAAMKAAVDKKDAPTVINVIIDGMAQRKPQVRHLPRKVLEESDKPRARFNCTLSSSGLRMAH